MRQLSASSPAIRCARKKPITLVDFKAGFEDSARGNIVSLDWIIVVVDPTAAAVQMAINMRDMIDQLKAGRLPATAHLAYPELVEMAYRMYREAKVKDVLFILNKVRDEEMEDYLLQRLAGYNIRPVGIIHDVPSITAAWLKGNPIVEKEKTKREVERTLLSLLNGGGKRNAV